MDPVDYKSLNWKEKREIRSAYVEHQDGCCHYCKSDLSKDPPGEILSKRINWRLFPQNFLKYPVHLHHSHETGLTIGAVHAYCNAVLWQYEGE